MNKINLRRYDRWHSEEVNELIKLFKENYSDYKISKKLLRTSAGISNKRLELNLYKETNQKKWSNEETIFLRKCFSDGETDKEIGEELGRNIPSIEKKRVQLGLIKKKNYWSDEEINLLKHLKFEKHKTNENDIVQIQIFVSGYSSLQKK